MIEVLEGHRGIKVCEATLVAGDRIPDDCQAISASTTKGAEQPHLALLAYELQCSACCLRRRKAARCTDCSSRSGSDPALSPHSRSGLDLQYVSAHSSRIRQAHASGYIPSEQARHLPRNPQHFSQQKIQQVSDSYLGPAQPDPAPHSST